jgi:hypothetical protein
MNVDLEIGGVIAPTTGGEPILRRENRALAILVAREEVTITGREAETVTVSHGGVQLTLGHRGSGRVRMLSLDRADGGFADYLRRVSG